MYDIFYQVYQDDDTVKYLDYTKCYELWSYYSSQPTHRFYTL